MPKGTVDEGAVHVGTARVFYIESS